MTLADIKKMMGSHDFITIKTPDKHDHNGVENYLPIETEIVSYKVFDTEYFMFGNIGSRPCKQFAIVISFDDYEKAIAKMPHVVRRKAKPMEA